MLLNSICRPPGRPPSWSNPSPTGWQLVLAALVGIGLIVGLITWAKIHPFLALIIGGLAVGIVAGVGPRRRDRQLHHRLR